MTKKTAHTQITITQIYRAVASSTAIETGVSVQRIEQQLKKIKHRRKPWASPVNLAIYRPPIASWGCSSLIRLPVLP